LLAVGTFCTAATVAAQNDTSIVDQKLDRPTLLSLGVQVLVAGDANRNATISVRYKPQGTSEWLDGLPLFHVRPSAVLGDTVPEQFAGSLFELMPATSYDIELHAQDPDGLDQTLTMSGTTRAVPGDPSAPHAVSVNDASSLSAALCAAQAGDLITLADGTYPGLFTIDASGTADTSPAAARPLGEPAARAEAAAQQRAAQQRAAPPAAAQQRAAAAVATAPRAAAARSPPEATTVAAAAAEPPARRKDSVPRSPRSLRSDSHSDFEGAAR
jgi:hypothetical protein